MLPCRQLEVGARTRSAPELLVCIYSCFCPFDFLCVRAVAGVGAVPARIYSTHSRLSQLFCRPAGFYDTGARKLLLQTTLKTMAMATAMATGTDNGNDYGLSCLPIWCTAVWSKPLMAKQVSRWILFYWECAPRRCLQFIGSDDDASRSYWRLSPVVRFIELFWLIVIWVGPFLGFFRSLFWPFLCHFSWQF